MPAGETRHLPPPPSLPRETGWHRLRGYHIVARRTAAATSRPIHHDLRPHYDMLLRIGRAAVSARLSQPLLCCLRPSWRITRFRSALPVYWTCVFLPAYECVGNLAQNTKQRFRATCTDIRTWSQHVMLLAACEIPVQCLSCAFVYNRYVDPAQILRFYFIL